MFMHASVPSIYVNNMRVYIVEIQFPALDHCLLRVWTYDSSKYALRSEHIFSDYFYSLPCPSKRLFKKQNKTVQLHADIYRTECKRQDIFQEDIPEYTTLTHSPPSTLITLIKKNVNTYVGIF